MEVTAGAAAREEAWSGDASAEHNGVEWRGGSVHYGNE